MPPRQWRSWTSDLFARETKPTVVSMWICIYQRAGLQNHRLKSLFCQLKIQRTQQPDSSQEARCHRTRETKSRVSEVKGLRTSKDSYCRTRMKCLKKQKQKQRDQCSITCVLVVFHVAVIENTPNERSSREKGLM